jgi:galactokinase
MNKRYFSAPGRVEIGGNHTDHQHGRVLAAAVDLEVKCSVTPNDTNIVNITNQQYSSFSVDLNNLCVVENEIGTAAGVVRGVAAWFAEHGHVIGGFDADITSSVPIGSGLSSSAAFEVLIGNVFKGLYNIDVSPLDIAIAGKYAENVYFGKPCGLMDQAASSFGGLNMIDFEDPDKPIVKPVKANLSGYLMCVVSTGGDHADLTHEYASIPEEMRAVARFFGKNYLREVSADEFYNNIGTMRHEDKRNMFHSLFRDRAILRAIHFFDENERVLRQVTALEENNIQEFFNLVIESGFSSIANLQNVYGTILPFERGISLALALSERILKGKGAWRVHGGGFAGTILTFLPESLREEYNKTMSDVFGEGCCHFLNVREQGGTEIT